MIDVQKWALIQISLKDAWFKTCYEVYYLPWLHNAKEGSLWSFLRGVRVGVELHYLGPI